MPRAKIGLLPLYLKLYDDTSADRRPMIEEFYRTIVAELERRDVAVITSPLCRLEREFADAVESFEKGKADAIVTLHMAYSPSLESEGVLSRTKLPVIVCDTTPSFSFGPDQNPDELMYNHGIHGVQDMCNLLNRRGKPFHIVAGHWQKSDVIDRAVELVCAAKMASHVRSMRAGLIGDSFKGMGDFYIPPDELQATLGVRTVKLEPGRFRELLGAVTDDDMRREEEQDRQRFDFDDLSIDVYRRSARMGLAVEKWIVEEDLGAFSYNFLQINRADGFEAVPFLQASKMMAKGVGFAGEGDILTASLVGALAVNHPDTSFTEMFCPDWEQNAVFLSHMGELNYQICAGKPLLVEMDYGYSDADNPVMAAGRFKPGKALLVNLAPIAGSRYRLIIVPVTVLDAGNDEKWRKKIRAWVEPPMGLGDFLASYSRLGGTHHLAITYAGSTERIVAFGDMMGWETVVVE